LLAARAHDISVRMHQCPFTRHCYSKPRGYPGDAELIDFVYKHPDARASIDTATSAGRTVLNVTVNVPACEAVRRRKEILARKVDEVANERSNAEVLAVACGHLREAESSLALKEGGIARLVATDQDQISLKKADSYRSTICSNIEVRNLTVRNLITAKHELGTFDLVYAAGLYDYLDARLAVRLTTTLFKLLKSGGRLLIPNFLTGLNQEAYMEVYMDWYLLYRTRAQIEAFSNGIPSADLNRTDYFEDETGTIGIWKSSALRCLQGGGAGRPGNRPAPNWFQRVARMAVRQRLASVMPDAQGSLSNDFGGVFLSLAKSNVKVALAFMLGLRAKLLFRSRSNPR
jgi:extracellular factor (EF) 3-hydroxypalmitic acid methyl ester biosynthesis protein